MTDADLLLADLPAGLTVRAATPDDTDAVVGLVQRCDLAAAGELDSGRDEIAGMIESPQTDHGATVLAFDGDDLLLFLWVEREYASRETWVDAYADPARSTAQLFSAGLEHGIRAAQAHRAAAGGGEWVVRAGCFATDAPLVAGLGAAGFERVRRTWRMRIDLAAAQLPAERPLPTGVTVRVVRDEPGRRALHAVVEESFQDHWHHNDRDYETWIPVATTGPQDPDGWWLLEVDGVPAGACLLDDSRAELGDGYVRILGVLRPYRGRGLARLLLERAFRYYRDRGLSGVQLSVDSQSPTGANHLYENVGMRPVRVIDAWSLTL